MSLTMIEFLCILTSRRVEHTQRDGWFTFSAQAIDDRSTERLTVDANNGWLDTTFLGGKCYVFPRSKYTHISADHDFPRQRLRNRSIVLVVVAVRGHDSHSIAFSHTTWSFLNVSWPSNSDLNIFHTLGLWIYEDRSIKIQTSFGDIPDRCHMVWRSNVYGCIAKVCSRFFTQTCSLQVT